MAWQKQPGFGFPEPAEFVTDWYLINGQCLTCTEAAKASDWYTLVMGSIADMSSAPDTDSGALQITPVHAHNQTPNDTMLGCAANVNSLAASDPQWSRMVGHDGMIKIMFACEAESRGYNPPGFTQEVTTLLSQGAGGGGAGGAGLGGIDKRWLWAGAALAAFLVLRRK